MNKGRVEAFSDGVFAIAITLLVLTISEPSNYRNLTHELVTRWPALAAYIVSFAIVGIMWLNHHSIFGHLEKVDRPLIQLNLLLLLTIAFLPYPTGVLGEALARGEGTTTAAVFYGVTMVANALAWSALWVYGSWHRRLLNPSFPESERNAATFAFNIGAVVYLIALGVAFLNAYAFLAIQAVLALYYALDPLSRRAAHGPSTPAGAEGTQSEARRAPDD